MDQKIIKLNKQESKLLQFVQAATGPDNDRHPEFQCINVNGGIAGADGFRLHVIEKTGNEEFDALEGVIQIGKLKAGENYVEPVLNEEEQDKFPEWKGVCPTSPNGVLFAINPRFLADICRFADADAGLFIMVRNATQPIEIKGTCQGQEFYALVMPMHIRYGKESYFDMYQPHPKPTQAPSDIVNELVAEIENQPA